MVQSNEKDYLAFVAITNTNDEDHMEFVEITTRMPFLHSWIVNNQKIILNKGIFELYFLDLKPNLKNYSKKRLESSLLIPINAYISMCYDKTQLILNYTSSSLKNETLEDDIFS